MRKTDLNYSVVFQKEPEGGYTAFVPSLPGCVTYGKTLGEAKKMTKEAIELYIESVKEHKEDLPIQRKTLFGKVHVREAGATNYQLRTLARIR